MYDIGISQKREDEEIINTRKNMMKSTNEARDFLNAVRVRDSLRTEMDELQKRAKNAEVLRNKLALLKEWRALRDDYSVACHSLLKAQWALDDALCELEAK